MMDEEMNMHNNVLYIYLESRYIIIQGVQIDVA